MTADVLDRLIEDAAKCARCGKEHKPRPTGTYAGPTWADPNDGHPYYAPNITVAWLRAWQEATR